MALSNVYSHGRKFAFAIPLLLTCLHSAVAQQNGFAYKNPHNQEQFSFGIYNYGFMESVYSKYTGYSEFDNGSLPTTFFSAVQTDMQIPYMDSGIPLPCIAWDHLVPIDYDMPGGFSYGIEFLNFAATSETFYTGDEKTIVVPKVEMRMYLLSVTLKLFLFSPFEKQLQPYFGVAWGVIGGDFDAIDVDGMTKKDSTFFGRQNSRMIGIQMSMSARWGGILELRGTTAFATTSNDPFNRSDKEDLEIDFSGSMISATAYYRF